MTNTPDLVYVRAGITDPGHTLEPDAEILAAFRDFGTSGEKSALLTVTVPSSSLDIEARYEMLCQVDGLLYEGYVHRPHFDGEYTVLYITACQFWLHAEEG